MADERFYRVSLTFDPEAERFIARVPELDAEAKGDTRAEAIESLEEALEQRVERAAVDGEDLPPPLDAEEPPLELALTLAPSVARELRFQARRAGLSIEALAQQLIAQGTGPLPAARRNPPSRRAEATESSSEAETQPPTTAQPPKRHKGRRRRQEGYRPDIDDQANFLAYVRDMEKGGRRRG